MGAETDYYVKVQVIYTEWRRVQALHHEEAKHKALCQHDVIGVEEVLHWSVYEDRMDEAREIFHEQAAERMGLED